MTIKATRFTPERLLGAPRRSAGVPNSDGSKVLYRVAKYSFADHKEHAHIEVLDSATGDAETVTSLEGASEPQWLGDELVLVLAPGEKGATRVVIGSVDDFADDHYVAGTIDGPADSVRVKKLPGTHGKYLFAISANAKPDGSIYNPESAPEKHSSGRVYSSIFVRHWDYWLTSNRKAIWYGTLSKESGSDRWELSKLKNALKGTGLESPMPPFGGTDHFDISQNGLVFVAKDPELQVATNTKSNLYISILEEFNGTQTLPEPVPISVNGFEGASSSPVFSVDGTKVAWLQMTENGYEADRNEIFAIPDIRRPAFINHLMGFPELKEKWDVSPSSITWSVDGKRLLMTAEEKGVNCLWTLDADYLHLGTIPTKLFGKESVSTISLLHSGDAFISATSMVDNSAYYRLKLGQNTTQLVSSNTNFGSAFGLSTAQIDDIWFEGAEQKVHAWVIKPSNFKRGEKYPLAYLIHGGPQGAWENSWSTRWNPAVFAEQGYVVVAPNPTGSTGYGKAFCDAIQNQWGGLPYRDIVKGFEYIEDRLDYVDTERAVILGASYGGYMMNWVQGHPLGRKFKAIVCHDGVFSMAGQMASEELWFPEHDLGGKLWDNSEKWLRWDPARFTENWATPQLVIHSEKDYRLAVSEGLAAFNVLQDRGVESKFLTFPDENHWVLQPENSLLWHTVVLDFINEHVGLPLYSEQSKRAKELLEDSAVVNPTKA